MILDGFKGHGKAWCLGCQWILGMYGDWLGHAVEANACWMLSARFSQTASAGPYVSQGEHSALHYSPRCRTKASVKQIAHLAKERWRERERERARESHKEVPYSQTPLSRCQMIGIPKAFAYSRKTQSFSVDHLVCGFWYINRLGSCAPSLFVHLRQKLV